MVDVAPRALRRGSAVVVASVVVLVVVPSLRPIGTEPTWLAALGRVVPLTLLAAGIAQWFIGRTIGSLAATLAALSWAGVTWGAASVTRSDPLSAVGFLVAPLLVPWLVLQVAELSTAWRPRRAMSVVAVAFVGIGLAGVIRALVYEPLLDLKCGPFCGHSPILLTANQGLASILEGLATTTTIFVSGFVIFAVVARSIRQPPAGLRAAAARVLVIVAMVGLASATVLGVGRTAAPRTFEIARLLVSQAAACVALAVAVLLVVWDRISVRRNLAEVARLLGERADPRAVEATLSRAVGDPNLRVGYWADEIGYVDADGLPLDNADGGQKRTELVSRGRPVAVLIHDNELLPSNLLDEHFGPQARLAIQNESLQLQLRRRVDELRSSRRRIVEVGEAERRKLERDLHDGAQQLLLALSFELRRGERAAAGAGDAVATARFSEARDQAGRILEELRALAHGIHPDILTGAGLEEALHSYASAVRPSPRLSLDLSGRLPEDIESAVYAISIGLLKAAPGASISIARDGDTVRMAVADLEDAPESVLDRLGAAGGSSVHAGRGLELVLPCA
jgi:signal transduction histidine kinase